MPRRMVALVTRTLVTLALAGLADCRRRRVGRETGLLPERMASTSLTLLHSYRPGALL